MKDSLIFKLSRKVTFFCIESLANLFFEAETSKARQSTAMLIWTLIIVWKTRATLISKHPVCSVLIE